MEDTGALGSPRTSSNEMHLHCQKSMEVCVLWVSPYVRAGEKHEEEGVVKKTHDELTTSLLPYTAMVSWERR